MAILEAGKVAQGAFSSKGLNAWKSATSPLMSAYEPAARLRWQSTSPDGPDYGQWSQYANQLGFNGPIYGEPYVTPDGWGYQGYSPEFVTFVDQARAQGYDFVQDSDNAVNFNQRYGFRLPSGEVVGQTSIRSDQDVRDFGMSLLPIASMMLGVPGIGGSLATSIGSAILPEATAAAIGSALGASASTVTSAIGQAAIQSGLTALGGGDTEDILRAGALPIAAPVVSGLVGQGLGAISPPDFDPSLGQLAQPMQDAVQKAITAGTLAEIRGGDFTDAALSALATPVAQAVVPSGLGALEKPAESALTSGALAAIRGQDPVDAALTSAAGSTISAAVPRDLGLLERPLEQALATAAGTAIAGGDVETRFRQALSSAMAGATAEQIGKDFGLSGATSRSILDAAMSGGDMNKMFNAMVATSKDLGRQVNVADAGGIGLDDVYANLPASDVGEPGAAGLDVIDAGRAAQRSRIADYIRQRAQSGVEGFEVYPNGTLAVTDYDSGVTHKFAADGSALGSNDVVFVGRRPTSSDEVLGFLNDPYVQSLFGGAAGESDDVRRRLIPEVTEQSLGDQGAASGATAGQSDQLLQDLEEEYAADELMQVNPPVSMPEDVSDTSGEYRPSVFDDIERALFDQQTSGASTSTGVDTSGDYGQSVFDEIDRIAEMQDPVTQQRLNEMNQQFYMPTQLTSQQPAGLSESQVRQIVAETLAANPSLTAQQVRQIVDSAVQSMPPGLTLQDVSGVVDSAISRLPKAPTASDIDAAIGRATAGMATRADVEQAVRSIQFPEGINQEDVTRAISDYMAQNPGLTATDVAQQVEQQLRQLPTYATPEDVRSTVRSAVADVATKADVQRAIAGIQFPAGLSEADVSRVITDYMRQNPGLSSADVAAQVGQQLKQLPTYATPADVDAAISRGLTNVATRSDVAEAIRNIQFPAGISETDVTRAITDYMRQNPGLSSQDVAEQVNLQLRQLPTYATPSDVNAAIRGAMTDVATRSDVQAAIAGIQFPAGISRADVTDVITDYMRQNPGLSAAEVTSLVGEQLSRLPAFATPQDVESTVRGALAGYATSEDVAGLGRGLEAVRADLTQLIADAQASGLQGDAALRAGLDALAGDLGTTRADLLSQLGTTEQALRADLGAQLTGVQSQVTQLGSELSRAIEAARAEGLQGEEALRAGLNSLAGELGTTKDDLLSRLGTSEQALRSDFASQLGGVQSQVTQLGSSLSDAIAEARASGLQGDAALQAGLDTLAGSLGTTRQELLSRLGTSEQALRSDFASQIGGVQSQVSQLGGELSAAIEAARASGLQGDAALQAGLTSLAGELGTTKAGLLSQLGQTEEALRSQFQTAIGGLETGLTGQIGGLRQEVQEQYDMLSAAQQAEVARRVQQGEDLNRAIADVQTGLAGTIGEVEAGLTGQIGGLRQEVQQQYSALSAAQQAEVERRVQQGADLTQAISDVRSGLAGTIAGVEAGLTGQIGGLRQEMSEQYQMLSDAQQAEVQRRISQGENLEAAINAVSSGLSERLSGVETGLTQKIGGIEDRLNDRIDELVNQGVDFQTATNQALQEVTGSFRSLAQQQAEQAQTTQQAIGGVETRLGDRIDQLMQQGVDWQTATEQAISELSGSFSGLAEQTQSSISGLGLDIQSQIEEMQRRSIDAQTASDLATLDRLERMAIRQQESEAAAIAERAAAEERAAQRAAQAAAQSAEESRRSRLMGLASSFASQQGSQAAAADPYKATFLTPYIVGGTAPEKFEGPLSGFLKQAMTGDFLPDKPQDQPRQSEDQQMGADQFFSGSNPLDMYQPEQEYQGLFGFRAGGVVPFMAQGGTRYGHNAHGALRVLEHSGKHRVDYRQGDAVTGIGDGQSDDIPAMLADGEFVIPADVVAALGNGSTKAGSDKLYEMMHNIRRHHRSTGPKDLPPPAKAPLEYIKSRKGRSA